MKTTIERVNAEYISKVEYELYGEKYVTQVKVTIDYKNSKYSIKPLNGDKFYFPMESNRHQEWMYIAKAIENAIEFAETELF